jgi:hypothetical protein
VAYATIDDVASGFRDLTVIEKERCTALLDEAAIIIDAYNADASDDAKKVVSCRMVRRQLGYDGDGSGQFPMGSTQGTVSAMGYSQSWTMGSGSSGELYLNKLEKKLLGCSNRIGSYSPVEELI